MANATINIDINTKEGVKNLDTLNKEVEETVQVSKNLKTQLREMTLELQGLEPGTKRFNELSQAAGQLRDQINDTNAVIKATAGSTLENMGKGFAKVAGVGIGAFQGIASAQALFGSESEDLQKTLVKLQAAAGLASMIEQFGGLGDTLTEVKASFNSLSKAQVQQAVATGTATTAQKILNSVMSANPVFLIIGGITALVGAYYLLTREISAAEKAQVALNEVSTKALDNVADELSASDKLQKTLKDETISRSDKVTAVKALQEQYPSLLSNIDAEKTSTEDINKALELNTKLVFLKAKLEATAALRAEQYKKVVEEEVKIRAGQNVGIMDNIGALLGGLEAQDMANLKSAATIVQTQKQIKVYDELDDSLNKQIENLKKKGATDGELTKEEKKRLDGLEAKKKDIENKNAVRSKNNEDIENAQSEMSKKLAGEREKLSDEEVLRLQEDEKEKLRIVAQRQKDELQLTFDGSQKTIQDKENLAVAQKVIDDKLTADIKKITDEKEKQARLEVLNNEKKLAQIKLQEVTNVRDLELSTAQTEEEKQDIIAYYSNGINDERKKVLDAQMKIDLESVNGTENAEIKRAEIVAKYNADIIAGNKEVFEAHKKGDEEKTKSLRGFEKYNDDATKSMSSGWKAFQEEWQDDWAGTMEKLLNGVSQTVGQVSDLFQQAFDQQNQAAEDRIKSQNVVSSEALKTQLAERLITQEQYDLKVLELQKENQQKELALKKKAFDQSKKIQIVNATIQGAQAVLSAYSSGVAYPLVGPATGAIFAGVAAGIAATQIGLISKQEFRAARGGVVPGMGPGNVDSVQALLAPGETVINARSSSMFPSLLSDINRAGGGVSLAPETAMTNNVSSNKTESAQRAYVVYSDIKEVDRKVTRGENQAKYK